MLKKFIIAVASTGIIFAGSGTAFADTVEYTQSQQVEKVNWAQCIPAVVGGALVGYGAEGSAIGAIGGGIAGSAAGCHSN